jgi:hypothetical protein
MTGVSSIPVRSAYLSKDPSGLLAAIQVEQQFPDTTSAGAH